MRTLSLLVFLSLITGSAFSSTFLDNKYGYKNMVAIVVNVSREPVYGEHVETELLKYLRAENRFEFSDDGYLFLKDGIKTNPFTLMGGERVLPWKLLTELAEKGSPTVILGEVIPFEEKYKVVLWLISTTDGRKVFGSEVEVEKGGNLTSFTYATRAALDQVLKVIPYDATVIRRDGYRVVLDRGKGAFRVGMELPVYTIEETPGTPGQLLFTETGLIRVTQVDANLAFAKISAERRPLEIQAGNKIRFPEASTSQLSPVSFGVQEGRNVASVFGGESFEVTKGQLGMVHADVGPSLMSVTSTTASATGSHSAVAPKGNIKAELWLTSRYFTSLNLGYGMSAVGVQGSGTQRVSSSVSDFRFLVGYRLNLLAPERGPVVHIKTGYGSNSYSFGTPTSGSVVHADTSYSGFVLGGGVEVPFDSRWSGGLDLNTLVFPSASNARVADGISAASVAAWDITFRGIYNLNREMDIEGKVLFQRNGAVFPGSTTVTAVSQTIFGGMVGLNYYY